ncbi:MAG: DNA-3-methyladenine glycosylase family protein [Oscillospiraceae bacterium]|jgi:N-glycosylase/DNA lyase
MGTYTLRYTDYSLDATLDCGQCFNFSRNPDGSWTGVALERQLTLAQKDGEIVYEGVSEGVFLAEYVRYLALDDDYSGIKSILAKDEVLREAIGYAPGIRIMHQPFWNTLLSFIVSQNNNIPRIKGILSRLCSGWGRDYGSYRGFPEASALAGLSEEDLAPLRCGYRAPYIIDCSKRYSQGLVDEDVIRSGPLPDARKELEKIKGVGPKVADCVLLFGAGRLDAFPVDTWMRKCMKALYPKGLPEFALPYAGIAQQYLFHYCRTSGIFS